MEKTTIDGDARLIDVVKYFEQLSEKHLERLAATCDWESETLRISYVGSGGIIYIPPGHLITEKALNHHCLSVRSTCLAVNELTLGKASMIKDVKQGFLG